MAMSVMLHEEQFPAFSDRSKNAFCDPIPAAFTQHEVSSPANSPASGMDLKLELVSTFCTPVSTNTSPHPTHISFPTTLRWHWNYLLIVDAVTAADTIGLLAQRCL
jgi:hypothetical protein